MAKNDGYDLSDALGKAVGSANNIGQQATNDAHSDEAGSPSEQAGSSLRSGANGLRNAVEAPGRIADTVDNIKDGAKKTGEAIKNAPENMRKAGEAIKNAPKNIKDGIKNAPKNIKNALKNSPKKIGEAIKNAPRKAWEKLIRKPRERLRRIKKTAQMIKKVARALLKVAQAVIKALIRMIIWLVTTLGPIFFGLILICALAFFFMNNMSTTGDVITDSESLSELNQTILTPNEEVAQVDVSSGNKIISAYYTYFSQKSLWVLTDGTVYNCHTDKVENNKDVNSNKMPYHIDANGNKIYEPVQYGSSRFIEIYKYDPFTGSGAASADIIQDKYGREKSFYLNASAIQSIDNTLNHGQFRYPEQIVQKVKYKVIVNPDGSYHYELDDLADEDGNLYTNNIYDDSGNLLHTGTLSTAYTQDESETSAKYTNGKGYNLWIPYIDDTNKITKRVPGVWDYGFGSILHYIKYIEAHENRGNVMSFQVLDKNEWNLTSDSATGFRTKDIELKAVTGKYGTYYAGLSTGVNVNLYKQGVITEYSYDAWYAAYNAGMTSTGGDFNNLWSGDGSSNDPTSDSFDTSRVYPLADTESYMIDWAVTPAGTMSNKIETVWKNSGIPFNKTEDQSYTNGKINAMIIEHLTNGTATFNWGSSSVNTSTGSYTNPKTKLYLIQYEPTGNTQVDGQYTTTAYTENGNTKYYITAVEVSMFNADDTCKACGESAVEKVYAARSHNSCYNRSYQVPIKGQTGTKTYTVTKSDWKNTSLKVNSKTGAVTQNPYIKVPKYWDPSLNNGAGGWSSDTTTYKLINTSTNKCNYCGNSASKVSSYKARNHDSCKTIKYEYDVIKMKEVSFTDANWGLVDKSINLTRFIEGTKWDKEPTYSGEPDMSGVTGSKYYEDYFTHYETYIPEKVQGDFNFNEILNQTGLDQDQLLALLERENFTSEIATLSSDDYFIDTPVIESDGTVKGYVGPGFGLVTFETGGLPTSESDCKSRIESGTQCKPNSVTILAGEGWTNYGVCQMNRGTLDGFYSWMMIDADRTALWDKIFNGVDYNYSSPNTPFSKAWAESNTTLSEDEYITFMLYQLAYMYKIKVMDQDTMLQTYANGYDQYRASQELIFACGNNGALTKNGAFRTGPLNGTSSSDIINGLCDRYSTIVGFGAYTATMHQKYDVYIRQFYTVMDDYNLPIFEWDEEKEMFVADGEGTTSSGWSLGKLWRALTFQKQEPDGTVHFIWNDIFKNSQIGVEQHTTSGLYYGTDANSAIERIHYKTNAVAAQDINWEIAKIFATIDKVTVDTYYPLTDDFFILKYEEIFSSDIGRKWSTGNGFAKYFGSSWSNVFSKSSSSTDPTETDYSDLTITQLNEFNLDENSVILKLSVASGATTDADKMAASIHSVADGVVLEIGSDIIYGGNYIAIEYDNCIVYYGGFSPLVDLTKGKAVHKQDLIGAVPFGNYFYLAMKTDVNGSYIDPTKLLQSGGVSEVVDLARTFLGTDYEWGGTGLVRAGNCCSSADHAKYSETGDLSNYAFDCSGFMRYLFTELNYTVSGGANDLSYCGVDITADYTVNGAINWDAVPVGTVVFMNTAGDSRIDHVGLWTGYSLLHASGGNPWSNGAGTDTYYLNNKICFRPQKNHARNGKMVKEDYLTAIPADLESQYQKNVLGYNVLNVSDWWVDKVVQINDFSSCKNS